MVVVKFFDQVNCSLFDFSTTFLHPPQRPILESKKLILSKIPGPLISYPHKSCETDSNADAFMVTQ